MLLTKVLITSACIWFIGDKLAATEFRVPEFSMIEFLPILSLVFFMMLMNWSLEAYRWKLSIPHEDISFGQGFASVLAGLSLNWVIPFTLGDAGARLSILKNKKQSAFAVLFNRGLILIITLIYGVVAVMNFMGVNFQLTWLIIGMLILIIGLIFFVKKEKWMGVDIRFLDFGLGAKVFSVTLLRYLIFTFQFFLVIQYFNPSLSESLIFIGIGWIFLFRSVIPSLFGNLGVREASAIMFFEPYMTDLNLIVFPCLLIWLINSVIPSLAGLIPIFKFRVMSNQDSPLLDKLAG